MAGDDAALLNPVKPSTGSVPPFAKTATGSSRLCLKMASQLAAENNQGHKKKLYKKGHADGNMVCFLQLVKMSNIKGIN